MMFYTLVYLSSVLVASISQIILKKSAGKQYENPIREYLNLRVIIAYGMFFLSMFLTMYAYKGIPLSFGNLLEAAGYIFVPVLSYFFLHEKLTKIKLLGAVLIIAGICCYALL